MRAENRQSVVKKLSSEITKLASRAGATPDRIGREAPTLLSLVPEGTKDRTREASKLLWEAARHTAEQSENSKRQTVFLMMKLAMPEVEWREWADPTVGLLASPLVFQARHTTVNKRYPLLAKWVAENETWDVSASTVSRQATLVVDRVAAAIVEKLLDAQEEPREISTLAPVQPSGRRNDDWSIVHTDSTYILGENRSVTRVFVKRAVMLKTVGMDTVFLNHTYETDPVLARLTVSAVANCFVRNQHKNTLGVLTAELAVQECQVYGEMTEIQYLLDVQTDVAVRTQIRHLAIEENFTSVMRLQFAPHDLPSSVWTFTNSLELHIPTSKEQSIDAPVDVNELGYVEHRGVKLMAGHYSGISWTW